MPPGLEVRRLLQSDRCTRFEVPGHPSLQQHIKRHAKRANETGLSATWVAVDGDLVAAFVTFCPAIVRPADVTGLVETKSRNPLPVLLLGLMATDASYQRRGLARRMVKVVLEQAVTLAATVGCVGVLVDAKASAVGFYDKEGFTALSEECPASPDAPDEAQGEPATSAEAKTRMFMPMAHVRLWLESEALSVPAPR